MAIPRDRDSSFEPELVKKGQTRIDGMEDRIAGLYAAGLTVRDIRAHLLDLYGLRGLPDLVGRIAENEAAEFCLSVMNELKNRGLQAILIAVVAGLKSAPPVPAPNCPPDSLPLRGPARIPEAITAAFPKTTVHSGAPPVRGWIDPPDPFRDAFHPASSNCCAMVHVVFN